MTRETNKQPMGSTLTNDLDNQPMTDLSTAISIPKNNQKYCQYFIADSMRFRNYQQRCSVISSKTQRKALLWQPFGWKGRLRKYRVNLLSKQKKKKIIIATAEIWWRKSSLYICYMECRSKNIYKFFLII